MDSKKNIRLLLVDDSDDDRDLILMNLMRGGYSPDTESVDTREEFVNALENHKWDLIICDYSMPGFDGITALNILRKEERDIPFILVSGAIGEELAVKAMKAGANDYLMKDNLQRLVPAIERELKDAEVRRKHREAQRERDRLLTVIQNSLNEIFIFDCKTLQFRYLNQTALENLGYDESRILQMTPVDINPELDKPEDFNRIIQPLLKGNLEKDLFLTKHLRADGSTYPIEIHLQLIRQGDEEFFTAIGFDLTDREKDAQRIREQKEIAREMAQHSKHKSEFLANMSHELRTPLNSILLLSELLLKNKDENLTESQRKYADVIHRSGNNLLELINEVLDLSKIESGEMELAPEEISLEEVITSIRNTFEPIAEKKDLRLSIETLKNPPSILFTDQLKLEQILRNLVSNALKFTEQGSVDLEIYPCGEHDAASTSAQMICFRVSDTGIGIPPEKQTIVFESFRQADGSTQRKFGGTGLGLAICKQISELLGGTLSLESEAGRGSVFTLTIPVRLDSAINGSGTAVTDDRNNPQTDFSAKPAADPAPAGSGPGISGSFSNSATADLMIVSANPELQKALLHVSGSFGLKPEIVTDGHHAKAFFDKHSPETVVADPFVPGLSGWSVAKQLAENNGRNASIWIAGTGNRNLQNFTIPGIAGILELPASADQLGKIFKPAHKPKALKEQTLLLIDDNKMHCEALSEFAADIVDHCLTANTASEAYKVLETCEADCIVLDLSLPDSSGREVLETLSNHPKHHQIPVIIYSGRSLSSSEKNELMQNASDVIFKNVGSHSKLVKRISALLDSAIHKKPGKSLPKPPEDRDVLIVEDDEQSYFSLSSHLISRGLNVHHAWNGMEALNFFDSQPPADIIFMDVMMPEMDGFETLKHLRRIPALKTVPVITITAKAMSGDRQECLRLGATDYISKPVNIDHLDTLLSIWIDFA